MIKFKIYRDRHKNIVGYMVKGHAGYDVFGKDIVCAAISVLSQTALISLNKVCKIEEKDLFYEIDEEIGYINVSLVDKLSKTQRDNANIVLQTLELGIKEITQSYPEYITLEYGEV